MFHQDDFIERLKNELGNLPGEAAHLDMLPLRQVSSEALKKAENYRLSAVLLLLHEMNGQSHFVLTQRNEYKGKHSGQISFPGGKVEPTDPDTTYTALRETHEEIGIQPHSIDLMGRLTEVYIPVSNFLIHPYIGHSKQTLITQADPREVSQVIHASTKALLDDSNIISTHIKLDSGMVLKDIPAFNFDGHIVWGATAIILNEFKTLLKRF
jgi:8-oxo-dGTP pyrophosphatase MutT (NUDIX family)